MYCSTKVVWKTLELPNPSSAINLLSILPLSNLEIFRVPSARESGVVNRLDVFSVSGLDLTLNESLDDDYTKGNTLNMFRYFDTLASGTQSRNASYTAGTHGGSGGSRSELLDYYGGPQSQSDDGGITTYSIEE